MVSVFLMKQHSNRNERENSDRIVCLARILTGQQGHCVVSSALLCRLFSHISNNTREREEICCLSASNVGGRGLMDDTNFFFGGSALENI